MAAPELRLAPPCATSSRRSRRASLAVFALVALVVCAPTNALAKPPAPKKAPAAAKADPAGAPSAAPEGEAIELTWKAPEGCPARADVRARIAKRIGREPVGSTTLRASGSISREGDGFRLELRTVTLGDKGKPLGPAGERSLTASSCDRLAEAAALVIGLAFDPVAVALTEERERAPPPAPPPPPPPPPLLTPPQVLPPNPSWGPPPSPVLYAPPKPPPRKFTFGITIAAAMDAGALPSVAPGVAGGVHLAFDRARFEAGVLWLPGATKTLASRPGVGGEFSLVVGSLAGCGVPLKWAGKSSAELEIAACVGLEVGRQAGKGFGVALPKEGEAIWVAPKLGATARLLVASRVALRLETWLTLPAYRPQFSLDEVGLIHEPGAVGGRLVGGVDLLF